ncbi:ABC transporter substrate-binding protein [Halococcus agarilyticus]|uniref:ABC transporter substrate-binding protein n=1 Tax=Halococcus agarilyticus TaxID=1232219 RepID=UPI0006781959|nr:ABC transporter substrate-binding protein [Halococcus agarilyticus]
MVNNGNETSGEDDERSSRRTFLKATGGAAVGAAVAGCLSLGGGDGGDSGGDGGSGDGGSGGSETAGSDSGDGGSANDSGGGSGSDITSGDGGSGGNGTGDTDGGGGTDTESGNGSSGGGGGSADIEGPITIGALAPNPENNPIGASIVNGARLAVQELNANDGIGGAEVELAVGNTEEDPSTGQQRYRELVLNEEADVTTGIFTSEVLLNIIDDIAQQGTIHLTAGAATAEVSRMIAENYDQFKYHFRAGPLNDLDLGRNLLDFGEANFEAMGWDSTYAMVEDYTWTEPISELFDESLGEVGVEVAGNQRYASGTTNFGPLFDDVESSDASGMFTAMAHTGTEAVVQWAKQQRPFGFAGIHVPMQLPSYYEAVNGACLYGVTQTSATPQSEVTEKTQPFVEAYNEEFDSYPVYTGYIAYDAVKLYAAMVEQTGTTDADELVSAMEQASFTATTGTLEFYGQDEEHPHDPVYGEDAIYPVFLQWQEGEDGGGVQEVVWPEQYKTADYQPPAWL